METDFRRDYLTEDAYHVNVDARSDIDDPEDPPSQLTAAERRDLLRNRCLIRPPGHDPTDESESPSNWRLTAPRHNRI